MRGLGALRSPLLHFLVGGAVMFRLAYGPEPFSAVADRGATTPVVVTAADVARLRTEYSRETGLEPTAADEAVLIDKAIEEELLFREAVVRGLDRNDRSVRSWLIEQMAVLNDGHSSDAETLYARARALGLDRTDLVVRRILVQKMRLLATRTNEHPPSDDELRRYYAGLHGDYAPPPRVSFRHVFLASPKRGDAVPRDAEALLAELRQQQSPAESAGLGDPFSVPQHLVAQSTAQIAKLFGAEFAARIVGADSHQWIGPVPSAYGTHLVWIEAREPSAPPAFESVRQQVLERWQNEQRKQRVAALLRELEGRYPLQVESTAWRPRRSL